MGLDNVKTPSKTPSKKSAFSEKKAPKSEAVALAPRRAMTEKKAPKPEASAAAAPKVSLSEKKAPKVALSEKKAPKPEAAAALAPSAKKVPKVALSEKKAPKVALSEKKAPKPEAAAPKVALSEKKAPKPEAAAAPKGALTEKKRPRPDAAALGAAAPAPAAAAKGVSKGSVNQSAGLAAVLAQHSTNKLNEELAGRALDALLHYTAKVEASARKPDLLGGDGEKVHMQLTLKRVPADPSPKPIPLPVPHPIRGAGSSSDSSVCLFVKGDDKAWVKELMLEGAGGPLSGVAKVISLEKLRTSYGRFEQRRELLNTYDVFMCDDRIVPMMTQALGKTFLSRKKQPVAVKVSRKASLAAQISKLRECAYLFLSAGTCVSVCVGTTAMPREHLLANLAALLPLAVEKLPRKWKNVQAVSVKTTSSIALPVLNKLPFIVGQSPAADEDSDSGDEDEDAAAAQAKAAKKAAGKGIGASTAAAVKAAARAAKAEAAAGGGGECADGAAPAAGGGKKRRGGFDRKSKAAPAQNSKLDRRSPSPAATRAKKVKVAKQ